MNLSTITSVFAQFKNLLSRGSNFNAEFGEQAYKDSTIITQMISYSNSGSGIRVFGSADFGPTNIFDADAVFVDATETAFVNMVRGIAFEPVGSNPPGFIIQETMFANPANGDHSWSVGDNFSFSVDTTAETAETQLGPSTGRVRIEENTNTSQVDIRITPSAGMQGYIYVDGLINAVDDTAAGNAGVPVNALYRNGSAVQIRVS